MWKLRKSRAEAATAPPAPPVTSEGPWPLDENGNADPWGLIDCHGLAQLLRRGSDKVLVIDSRSFLEYNTAHIQQSTNVCCSKLAKRRLQQDKVHVRELLRAACGVEVEEGWHMVVYDQCSEDPALLTQDNFVYILLQKLASSFSSVTFLKGGFLTFQAVYPMLCESKSGSRGIKGYSLTSMSQPCLPVSNIGPTRILPFLYLGSQQDALSQEVIQVIGVSFILNVSATCPKPGFIQEGHFCRIPINDNYTDRLQPFFPEAFQFLDKVREANGCVLVHCLAGISRSPTLAMAYIMKLMKMSADDAYRYVKDKRPTISPNFNFLGQLLEWQEELQRQEAEESQRRHSGEGGETPHRKAAARASPFVMDLQLCSPSSPGAKGHRLPFPFAFDLPPTTGGAKAKAKAKAKSAPCMLSPSLEVAEEKTDSCPSTPAEEERGGGEMVLTVEKVASATKRSFTLSLGLVGKSSPSPGTGENSPATPGSAAATTTAAAAAAFPPEQRLDSALPGPKGPSEMDGCEAAVSSSSSSSRGSLPGPSTLNSEACPLPGPASMDLSGTRSGCAGRFSKLPEPSSCVPGASTGFPGPSSDLLPGPSPGLPGPSSGFPGPSLGLPGPQLELPGPSSGQPGPSSDSSGSSAAKLPSSLNLEGASCLPGPSHQRKSVERAGHQGPARPTSLPEPRTGFPGPSDLEGAAVLPGPSPDCVSTIPSRPRVPGLSPMVESMSPLPGPGLDFPLPSSTTGFPGPQDYAATVTLPGATPSRAGSCAPAGGGQESGCKAARSESVLTAVLPEVGPTVELPAAPSAGPKAARPSSATFAPPVSGGLCSPAVSSPIPSPIAKRKAAMALPGLPSPTSGLARLHFSPTTEQVRAGQRSACSGNRLSLGSLSPSPLASPSSARTRLSFELPSSKRIPGLESPSMPSRSQQTFDLSVSKVSASRERRSSLAKTWPAPNLSGCCDPQIEVETAFTSSEQSSRQQSAVVKAAATCGAARTSVSCDSTASESFHGVESSSSSANLKHASAHLPSSALGAPAPSLKDSTAPVSGAPSSLPHVPTWSVGQPAASSPKENVEDTLQLADFPMTSLDQLSFTPCVAGDDIKLQTKPFIGGGGGTKRPLSESSTPSPTSPNSSPCHVVSSPSASSSSSLASTLSSAPASEGRPEPASPMSVDSGGSSSGNLWPALGTPTSPAPSALPGPTSMGPSTSTPQGLEGVKLSEGRTFLEEGEGVANQAPLSPMSICSSSGTSSPTSTTQQVAGVVVKRRSRENKAKRPVVRPNSIAFSSYPTFDLAPGSQESGGQASQDDASEAYMLCHGKKSKPSLADSSTPSPASQQRYRWGYCDSAVYRQISAAMESAMMQTRIQQASRKARSLDDILASDDSSSDGLCQCSMFRGALQRCGHSPGLAERLPCRCRGSSDPYQSNSSISSSGSHSSVHSSLEIIQVS